MKTIKKNPKNFEGKNSTNNNQFVHSQINLIPQTKSTPSKTSLFTPISLSLSSLLLSASIGSSLSAIDISYQAHIKPSQTAIDAVRHRGNNTPRVTQANNGVPIVDIADPNKAGISNNYFQDFNVSKDGLIFNNSKELFTNTTLAGYINGNSNLKNEASLILGQVTGSNPSSLLGVMEIAGKKADLIIANPNGITCNGCGVLNAKSFTLSTGSISQDELDRIANSNQLKKTLTMMTERGHINIEALNASNVSKLNIIAQTASVNGALYAQDLQMILGTNKITFDLNDQGDASLLLYEPITLKTQEGSTENKLALDVSHLGSVVANSIYLVATEEGVGVKNSGSMATIGSKEKGDGGFVIDVNGTITISTPEKGKSTLDQAHTSPSMISSNDLTIRAKKLHNGSIISADDDISITADEIVNQSRCEIENVVHYDETSWKVNLNLNKIVVKTWRVEERFKDFSPALIRSGKNLTLKAKTIENDRGHLEAGGKAIFESKNQFVNSAPALTIKTYQQKYKKYGITGKKKMRFEGLVDTVSTQGNLPQYNAQDLILANQESILKNTLDHINNLHFTQESREEFTKLDSFLSTQSFQDHLKVQASIHPTVIKQEFEQAKELDRLKSQQAQIQISLEESLKHRLNQVQEDRSKIDPNDFSHIGIKAQDLTIEAGEIINSSLIDAGYTTLVGESVINKNGIIASKQDLNIQAKDFKNLGADLIAGNDLKIKADRVEIGTTSNQTDSLGSKRHTTSNLLGNNISIQSNTDAHLTSVNMKANNNLSINAKNDVILDTVANVSVSNLKEKHYLGFSGGTLKVVKEESATVQTTHLNNSLSGGKISITSGGNLTAHNLSMDSKGDIKLDAGKDLTLGTKTDKIQRYTQKTNVKSMVKGKFEPVSEKPTLSSQVFDEFYQEQSIKSGENINISSKGNTHLTSVNMQADKNLSLNAKGDVVFDTVTQTKHTIETTKKGYFGFPTLQKTDSILQVSNSLQGNNVTINSGKNLTANNLGIQAENDVALKASGNIALTTKEDTHHSKSFFQNKTVDKIDHNVQAITGKNIAMSSGKDINLHSVDLGAEKNLSISAKDNVTLDTLANTTTTTTKTKKTKMGWFKFTTTTTTTTTTDTKNIANSLTGENISITAGKDLTGYNVKTDATEKLAMDAKNDLVLSTKADIHEVEEHKTIVEVGFKTHKKNDSHRKSVGISVGVDKTDIDTTTTQATHNNQTLSANKITLEAGNIAKLESVDTSSKDIAIKGKDVTIAALSDRYMQEIKSHTISERIGLDIGVSTNILGDGLSSHLGYTHSVTNSHSTLDQTSTSGSNINASNITISTQDSKNKTQGDINIIGSNLNGGNINLTGDKINIKAHENKSSFHSESSTKSASAGMTVGVNVFDIATIGGYAEVSGGKKNEEVKSTTHTGSEITGSQITINAKSDAKIVGSSVDANKTVINATNVHLSSTTDTHLNHQLNHNETISLDLVKSLTTVFNANLTAGANGGGSFGAGTKVNNASINSDSLTITTHKKPIDTTQADKNHKAIGKDIKKLASNLQSYIKAKKNGNKLGETLALGAMGVNALSLSKNLKNSIALDAQNLGTLLQNPFNGNLNINGGNINVKNDANIDLKGNLIITSQHDMSLKADANLGANGAMRGNALLTTLAFGSGNIKAQGEATLNSMSGISAGSVNIKTSSTNDTKALGAIAGIGTDLTLGIAGKQIGSLIGDVASKKVGELMEGKFPQADITKAQNFLGKLGDSLGETLQTNHKVIGNAVKEGIKGGNTFISNGYIQSTDLSKSSNLSTDKLVHQDIGNIKFQTKQDVNVVAAILPTGFVEKTLIDLVQKKSLSTEDLLSNALLFAPAFVGVGGNPVHIQTSQNNSSISSRIKVNSSNQISIQRGDKQESPSDIKNKNFLIPKLNIDVTQIIKKVVLK